jgi:hypothetical protein
MEHINIEIKGNSVKYAELTAEQGYCFYDVDETERSYTESIATPITDEIELERKFKVVYGDAEKLNEELAKEREKSEEIDT